MTKDELFQAIEDSHEALSAAIEALSAETLAIPGVCGEWSIKDVLFHLSMWESQLVTLLWQVKSGQKPNTAQLSGISDDELNARWQRLGQARSLENTLSDFHGAHFQVIRRLELFTENELTDPQAFPWMKGQPFWQMVADSTCLHKAEHLAQIQAWLAGRGGA